MKNHGNQLSGSTHDSTVKVVLGRRKVAQPKKTRSLRSPRKWRNQHFEVYEWDVGSSSVGISDWMRVRNVEEQDFVVMKAGEELVEEMMKDKTICMVDELFVECRRRWPTDEGGETETNNESRNMRVYWQCLALYGDLRDEGVVVDQWWS